MQIDVSDLLRKSGKRQRYEETWTSDELALDNDLYSLGETLEVSLFLHSAEDIIEVEGSYQGILEFHCTRCLKGLSEPLNGDVEARFYPPSRDITEDVSETDQANLFLGNYTPEETVDVGRLIREDIVLNRPMRILCKSDCEGLCPECGTNLNEEKCGHETGETIDPRLSKLQEIDVRTEESTTED